MPFSLHLTIASVIALVPILIWLLFFLGEDIKKPEPWRWLLILFLAGMSITPLVWEGENLFFKFLHLPVGNGVSLRYILPMYLVVAIIEELSKFGAALIILKHNKYFDEAIDAMVYLIVLALGFAFVENFLVAYQQLGSGLILPTIQITGLRFIGANLLHVISSGTIGFFWALYLLKRKKAFLFWGISLGILLHWFFNTAIIFKGGEAIVSVSLIILVSSLVLLWVFDIIKKFKQPVAFR